MIKRFLLTVIEVIRIKFSPMVYKNSLVKLYEERMLETSLAYAMEHFKLCVYFHDKKQLWDYTLSKIAEAQDQNNKGENLYLEFGTWKGASINYFSSRLKETLFYGFDSFEGLKEDWRGANQAKGGFNLNGKLPKVNNNVVLVRGWFDITLPQFLSEKKGEISFVHIDCDTYEATKIVLDNIYNRLTKNVYILFDEYIGYPGWREGEYKAFQELVVSNKIEYEYVAFSDLQVLIRIK